MDELETAMNQLIGPEHTWNMIKERNHPNLTVRIWLRSFYHIGHMNTQVQSWKFLRKCRFMHPQHMMSIDA